MGLDAAKQAVLDSLNIDQALAEIGAGAKIGATTGAIVGAAVGQIFPPASPILAGFASIYGAVIGSGVAFLHGLFTTNPEVTKRKARELVEQMFRANTALNNMFKTWPPSARDAFITTEAYRRLVQAAHAPQKYTDTLGYINDPATREILREQIRATTVSPAYPQGITLGDEEIKAQVKDRIEGRASAIQSGITTAYAPPRSYAAPVVVGLGLGATALGVWWSKRRQEQKKAKGQQ